MTIDINAHRWMFLRPEKADRYIDIYERLREELCEEGWKTLVPSTTRRQFGTAREILDRMSKGQKGVLLADDVGLGKTTVAALCALVFAGSEKRVRILAPNEMMSRRWRQELEIHIEAVARFAPHLDLDRAQRRLGTDVVRLNPGAIAVSTHQKAAQLACDLLIIDEAHRTRSEYSTLAHEVHRQRKVIGRVLVLTATPFSIDPNDLAGLLSRIGGRSAEKPMRKYARMLDDLWRGRSLGAPEDLARHLVDAARAAVDAMKPFVIRHGIDDLSPGERRLFGGVDDKNTAEALDVPDELLDAMLRTDRALALGRRCKAWNMKRRNDPRYHVAAGKLDDDLAALIEAAAHKSDDDAAALTLYHARTARRHLRAIGRHPKIADTVESARVIVEQGEKVLVFCDHHLPAVELTTALAHELRWEGVTARSPGKDVWRPAWSSIFDEIRGEAELDDGREHSLTRLERYLGWLMSDGVRMQIESWLGANLKPALSASNLKRLLEKTHARAHAACDSIADHARQLYKQLVDRKSGSTRAILLRDETTLMPGTTKARVAAVCEPGSTFVFRKHPGVFYPRQPDATLAVFNSPFGPDVLVATDRLSEGVDLHRFCRHLIHHELDPSPVRTVQRNGRLRRVNSWAALTKQPIRILYPALRGTRDEKLVEIMRYRLLQFDLLLGGVRAEIAPDEAATAPTTAADVLDHARNKLRQIRLGITPRRRDKAKTKKARRSKRQEEDRKKSQEEARDTHPNRSHDARWESQNCGRSSIPEQRSCEAVEGASLPA